MTPVEALAAAERIAARANRIFHLALAVGDAHLGRRGLGEIAAAAAATRDRLLEGLAAVLPRWPVPRPWPRRRPWWQVLSLRMGWWTLVLAGGAGRARRPPSGPGP